MKNLFLGLVMLMGTASFANTGDPVKELPVVLATTKKVEQSNKVNNEEKVKDDSLYCSVTVGANSASCWFCSCSELAKSLTQQ